MTTLTVRLIRLKDSGRKISAIKTLREATSMGLKEAKETIESLPQTVEVDADLVAEIGKYVELKDGVDGSFSRQLEPKSTSTWGGWWWSEPLPDLPETAIGIGEA